MFDDQNIDDKSLLLALKRKMMRDLEERQQQQAVVNNVYGGSIGGEHGGGVGGGLEEMSPEERDYFVDIARQNIPEGDAEMPNGGWKKSVHRYTQPKKKI
jgi:hypothetical protein